MSSGRSPRRKVPSDPPEGDRNNSPYRLRENSKLPKRYRNDESSPTKKHSSPSKLKRALGGSPKKSPIKRLNGKAKLPAGLNEVHEILTRPDSPSTSGPLLPTGLSLLATAAIEDHYATSSCALEYVPERRSTRRAIQLSPPRSSKSKESDSTVAKVDAEPKAKRALTQAELDEIKEHEDMQSFLDIFSTKEEQDHMRKQFSNYKTGANNNVSRYMRSNLKRLYNILRYKKARLFIMCEFFYSGIDQQIFLEENEFASILQESFPNLKTWKLNRIEWRAIRRLLGKPRRCSDLFFEEERLYLEEKRMRIRSVYEGSYLNDPSIDLKDLPSKLPKQLVVGNRVFARTRFPWDGIYPGLIDAVIPSGYRICFDNPNIPSSLIRDTEVILDGKLELLSTAYFIEQANSKLPTGVRPFVSAVRDANRPHLVKDELIQRSLERRGPLNGLNDERLKARNPEMVGNFPLKFLVNLVKLTKLIESKKGLVKQMTDMNNEAEMTNLSAEEYANDFKDRYARCVIDLEHVNLNIEMNMTGIQDHHMYFASSDVYKVKPEAIRKVCYQQAGRFVEHCNQGLNVDNVHALTLIQALTAALLQVRTMGTQKISATDLMSLSEAVHEIKSQISPRNVDFFQDYVEVHMKQFHSILMDSGAITGGVPSRQ